ncbi:HAMP domain-containing sensor histidine kinase [Variovorax sp. J22G73]|uniref:sensor histidine kinase n=1 Tax=unclassified Variovorax TaxID=663243 RepID=UPI002577CED9|nr:MULTISPECIES: HAMP domain-containing sensor histidine kinase [unclassified Variovorax]MDM0009497.1 HAMP domain-containing sensor histidine kinase [Variovorax sp. J22R203]MDM0102005.1 HAMP domain-containing sensor histidine kinase [Variovorax sp. J22G73]
MRLATFLNVAQEQILDAAEAFAKTIPALHQTDSLLLRDHLPHLLDAISADLRTSQSRTEAIDKSEGNAPQSSWQTSAQTHGLMRARAGIDIEQLVAEFRALRSSVLRLWGESYVPEAGAIEDIARFNEAIDQAVAESVRFYAQERERWRQIFLSVLGHDLRGPLNAIGLTVELMRLGATAPAAQTALLSRGVKRLTSLLDSLLEYSRASLGAGMVLRAAQVDLAHVCAEEIELLRAAHPEALSDYEATGDTCGAFDASRVGEALMNLVSNAIKHGDPTQASLARVEGHEAFVRITVENAGDEIAVHEFETLFEPLRQRDGPSASTERTHLGLGLFIARQIARAHGGEITGASSEGRIRFTIDLPRLSWPSADANDDVALQV